MDDDMAQDYLAELQAEGLSLFRINALASSLWKCSDCSNDEDARRRLLRLNQEATYRGPSNGERRGVAHQAPPQTDCGHKRPTSNCG